MSAASIHHNAKTGDVVVIQYPGGAMAGPAKVVHVDGDYVQVEHKGITADVDAAQCVIARW